MVYACLLKEKTITFNKNKGNENYLIVTGHLAKPDCLHRQDCTDNWSFSSNGNGIASGVAETGYSPGTDRTEERAPLQLRSVHQDSERGNRAVMNWSVKNYWGEG